MSVTKVFVVELPLPSSKLHSHNKGHWRTKSNAVKTYRNMAHAQCRRFKRMPKLAKATVHYLFELPDRRRRDAANLVHACKPAIDGCVDAGLIPDDCWEVLTIGSVSCVVCKPGRVVLTFEGVDES